MNISNKPCYPIYNSEGFCSHEKILEPEDILGLTFRERLIIALASNPASLLNDNHKTMPLEVSAGFIIDQADAIIKEMEKEK